MQRAEPHAAENVVVEPRAGRFEPDCELMVGCSCRAEAVPGRRREERGIWRWPVALCRSVSKRTRRVFLVLVTMALCAGGGSEAWASSGAVFGYGTVGGRERTGLRFPPTTPQDTLFNGARCRSLGGDFCGPRVSTRTCTANVKAVPGSDGWKFTGWSGGCDGSQETCRAEVSTQVCRDPGELRTCDPAAFSPPATARFEDVQPPIVTFTSGRARTRSSLRTRRGSTGRSANPRNNPPSFARSMAGRLPARAISPVSQTVRTPSR